MSHSIFAYCFACGVIKFGDTVPKGALAFVKGREDAVRDLICATSRHAYDGQTLLVPGVPEAVNQADGIEALIKYCDWLAQRDTDGVEILGRRTETTPAAAAAREA